MSGGLDTRPTATTLNVERLARWAWEGRIRIPHFQRPLRWQRVDVIKLFDSIVRGYPVGSLLLWHRPASKEILQLGALRIEAPKTPDALWVVDGQQRIISMANALHPDGQSDERFKISYDLRKKTFVPTPRETEAAVVPLPVIFDLREVLRWFADHPEAVEYVEDANRVTQTIRQFEIPAYEVSQENPEVLEDIFDRMNNYGKRLTRAEIFSALFAGPESTKDDTPTLDRIAQNINDDLDFGLIDNDTVLQAVLARRAPDVHREIRNEFGEEARAFIEFPGEDRDTAYKQGERTIRRAVRFLQTAAGVPHFTLLPYKYPLVVLTRLFAHYDDIDERSLQLVRRWFWRTVLVGPEVFRGSTSGAVRALNRAVRPDDLEGSIQRLIELVPKEAARVPDLRRFRSNEAGTKLLLGSWWSQEPRSLTNGQPFGIADLALSIDDARTPLDAVHYVVSRHSVRQELSPWSANRVLYPSVEYELGSVESILTLPADQRPLNGSQWATALASHNITLEMAAAIEHGNVDKFLNDRQDLLRLQLDLFLRQRCEWNFEDTPSLDSLIIDDEDETEELSDDESAGLF
ncbi:MAG TPA: DUF262 domain-containing protein [Streptosporangiaceae bacterium]|nr:DUF262 domain-containing protein [Streptosporangiaceae bacterium]